MFYAQVIIGNTTVMLPDQTIKNPPFLPNSTTHRYDSIQGHAGAGNRASDVFMVYQNTKAYPEYLITYRA